MEQGEQEGEEWKNSKRERATGESGGALESGGERSLVCCFSRFSLTCKVRREGAERRGTTRQPTTREARDKTTNKTTRRKTTG